MLSGVARYFEKGVQTESRCRRQRSGEAAATRGVWGHAPPENFLSLDSVRALLRLFLSEICTSIIKISDIII